MKLIDHISKVTVKSDYRKLSQAQKRVINAVNKRK